MIEIKAMDEKFILWRCLHGGPLSKQTMDQWPEKQADSWKKHRAVNVPLLQKVIKTYGTCAMVACDGDEIVGMLRFYPKALMAMTKAGSMCLQQSHPAGPADDLVDEELPSQAECEDRTLEVHCVMTCRPFSGEEKAKVFGGDCLSKTDAGARKGIGLKLAKALVAWAREQGWKRIEVTTHPDLDIFYGITGSAGQSFWQKAGFKVENVRPMPKELWPDENARALIDSQARDAGISTEQAWSFIDMACVLQSRRSRDRQAV